MASVTLSFAPAKCVNANLTCHLVASVCGVTLEAAAPFVAPSLPAMRIGGTDTVVFGVGSICQYIMATSKNTTPLSAADSVLLNDLFELVSSTNRASRSSSSTVAASLALLESPTGRYHKLLSTSPAVQAWAMTSLSHWLSSTANASSAYPTLSGIVSSVTSSSGYKKVAATLFPPSYPNDEWLRKGIMVSLKELFCWAITHAYPTLMLPAPPQAPAPAPAPAAAAAAAAAAAPDGKGSKEGKGKGDGKGEAKAAKSAAAVTANANPTALELRVAIITKCNNPAFGDYQCNNAMSLAKLFKVDFNGGKGPNYYGTGGASIAPKDIAARIVEHLPANNFIKSAVAAPNGFINITLHMDAVTRSIAAINKHVPNHAETTASATSLLSAPPAPRGAPTPLVSIPPPTVERPLNVLVDFSSPNIAKEMHVGHLRSTIIGDCVCRILEYCTHKVQRVNHVGDWGTQFGMLITYLKEEYPDILSNPPNISDLTALYKASKKRFDVDEAFKEKSRLNVVNLQSGNPECRAIWQLLCDISRKEFQVIYDALQVYIDEYGESYYNPMIPPALAEVEKAGLITMEEGMMLLRLPHFEIPLILRKSDGGYGYDSTDMAAVKHRCQTLKCDWVVYITDSGQANHFYMVFDAARSMKWAPVAPFITPTGEKVTKLVPATPNNNYGSNNAVAPDNATNIRLDHIGFGVVCGDDGKKFKTRSSETVKLIDLLVEAGEKMKVSLQARVDEGKTPLTAEELPEAARRIGYGAVKYFDLKQNPMSSYIFSYDRMLDTRGDTAVYLLFAFARVTSILRKARDDRNVDISAMYASSAATPPVLSYTEPSERALALEIMSFSDVIQSVLHTLSPNYLCDYLKELSVKFSDFVTKCQVLNSDQMVPRLALCEATKRAMEQCFFLLGIQTLDRI